MSNKKFVTLYNSKTPYDNVRFVFTRLNITGFMLDYVRYSKNTLRICNKFIGSGVVLNSIEIKYLEFEELDNSLLKYFIFSLSHYKIIESIPVLVTYDTYPNNRAASETRWGTTVGYGSEFIIKYNTDGFRDTAIDIRKIDFRYPELLDFLVDRNQSFIEYE